MKKLFAYIENVLNIQIFRFTKENKTWNEANRTNILIRKRFIILSNLLHGIQKTVTNTKKKKKWRKWKKKKNTFIYIQKKFMSILLIWFWNWKQFQLQSAGKGKGILGVFKGFQMTFGLFQRSKKLRKEKKKCLPHLKIFSNSAI